MARRESGRGRRVIVGLSAALAARARWRDAKFCMVPGGAACYWCDLIAAYSAGQCVETEGTRIWEALYVDARPREWHEFMRDESLYLVTGDRLELA